jgi:glycerol-3-phosphate dehydrogenase
LAGGENMETSYFMSRGKALEAFPMLKGKGLVGAVVYYDGIAILVAATKI